ncbi:MAG: hypothetical protein LUG94_05660 [Ruminococcus sp.]|nr:hypothetical protein [Ruminococcus sp.]
MKEFNFKSRKKEYFKITLPNDKVLFITTPTKAMASKIIDIYKDFDQKHADESMIPDLYNLASMTMNSNKDNVKISTEELIETIELADILEYLDNYMQFVTEQTSQKNLKSRTTH